MGMGNDKLTTAEALKFARHDFLNELQISLTLYRSWINYLKQRQKILEATDRMRQVAMLERLGLTGR